MKLLLFSLLVLLVSCSHSYYIVRHAEKATTGNMTASGNDLPLTGEGKKRAEYIKGILSDKKIAYVFATNTLRTKATAQPTAGHFHLTIETYGPAPDSSFIRLLKSKTKNTLVIGHSNTVDDIVNMLCNRKEISGDLPETEYNKLFIVTIKGKKVIFKNSFIYQPY